MKKILTGLKWIALIAVGLVLLILIPVGLNKLYENIRSSSLSQQEKYAEDLERLEYVMKHEFAGYNVLPTSRSFDSELIRLKESVNNKTVTDQTAFNLSVIKAVASFKDPHTSVYNKNEFLNHRFPYYLDWSDGDFYLLSGQVDKEWLGAKVTRIGNSSGEAVFKKLSAYTNSPNSAGTAFFIRSFLYSPEILHHEDIISTPDEIELELEIGEKKEVIRFNSLSKEKFASLSDYIRLSEQFEQDELPLYMKNTGNNYWYQYLPDADILYLRYSLCIAQGDIESFWKELYEKLAEYKPSKFVIDVRGNPGGDTQNHSSFLSHLQKDKQVNQYGKLFTLIDRGTGSAAVSFASDIEKMTESILVGEKTMDRPNTTSDPTFFTLPHSGITLLVPSLYSFHSYISDNREAISPDIPIIQKINKGNYISDEIMDSIKNLTVEGKNKYAQLPLALEGQYSFSPIRNASLTQKDSVWYFSVDGLIEAPVYQKDSIVFVRKYNISFTKIDTLGKELSMKLHNSEVTLTKIEADNISLEKSILNRDFELAEKILVEITDKGKLPYYLDRPYFQTRVYALYNQYGFEDAMALNLVTKRVYPNDPVVSIVDYELYQYENKSFGQMKSMAPVAGKLLKRYFTVITTEKVMNDEYNAFIGK